MKEVGFGAGVFDFSEAGAFAFGAVGFFGFDAAGGYVFGVVRSFFAAGFFVEVFEDFELFGLAAARGFRVAMNRELNPRSAAWL